MPETTQTQKNAWKTRAQNGSPAPPAPTQNGHAAGDSAGEADWPPLRPSTPQQRGLEARSREPWTPSTGASAQTPPKSTPNKQTFTPFRHGKTRHRGGDPSDSEEEARAARQAARAKEWRETGGATDGSLTDADAEGEDDDDLYSPPPTFDIPGGGHGSAAPSAHDDAMEEDDNDPFAGPPPHADGAEAAPPLEDEATQTAAQAERASPAPRADSDEAPASHTIAQVVRGEHRPAIPLWGAHQRREPVLTRLPIPPALLPTPRPQPGSTFQVQSKGRGRVVVELRAPAPDDAPPAAAAHLTPLRRTPPQSHQQQPHERTPQPPPATGTAGAGTGVSAAAPATAAAGDAPNRGRPRAPAPTTADQGRHGAEEAPPPRAQEETAPPQGQDDAMELDDLYDPPPPPQSREPTPEPVFDDPPRHIGQPGEPPPATLEMIAAAAAASDLLAGTTIEVRTTGAPCSTDGFDEDEHLAKMTAQQRTFYDKREQAGEHLVCVKHLLRRQRGSQREVKHEAIRQRLEHNIDRMRIRGLGRHLDARLAFTDSWDHDESTEIVEVTFLLRGANVETHDLLVSNGQWALGDDEYNFLPYRIPRTTFLVTYAGLVVPDTEKGERRLRKVIQTHYRRNPYLALVFSHHDRTPEDAALEDEGYQLEAEEIADEDDETRAEDEEDDDIDTSPLPDGPFGYFLRTLQVSPMKVTYNQTPGAQYAVHASAPTLSRELFESVKKGAAAVVIADPQFQEGRSIRKPWTCSRCRAASHPGGKCRATALDRPKASTPAVPTPEEFEAAQAGGQATGRGRGRGGQPGQRGSRRARRQADRDHDRDDRDYDDAGPGGSRRNRDGDRARQRGRTTRWQDDDLEDRYNANDGGRGRGGRRRGRGRRDASGY